MSNRQGWMCDDGHTHFVKSIFCKCCSEYAFHFSRVVKALCLIDPLYDLIIGSISGVRAPNDPHETWVHESGGSYPSADYIEH